MAEIATALYTRHLKFDAADPTWPDRDRVVLSNGHGSMLLYSLLYLSGYEHIGIDQIKTFRDLGSRCEGHPEFDPAAGIEVTTGPLGQGIANAFGMAVAEAYLNARFGAGRGRPPHLRLRRRRLPAGGHRPGDDLAGRAPAAGQADPALGRQPHHRRRRAPTCRSAKTWPRASASPTGTWSRSTATTSKPCRPRSPRRKDDPRPSMIACRTVIAKGIARLQGQRGGHSGKLLPEDAAAARAAAGLAASVLRGPRRRARCVARRRPSQRPPNTPRGTSAWLRCRPAERAEFERMLARRAARRLARGAARLQARAPIEREPLASGIFISAEINDLLTDVHARAHGRPAPTSRRRPATSAGCRPSPRNDRRGAYVHCGVREHVMGAMANGMAAHGGVIPLAVTYLPFADYERPAMRMAALMGLPVKFVFSHDSIGIGTQRADAPAGRDPRVAARDAQHAGAAAGRRGRSGRVLGDRARAPHAGRRRWCSRARRCRSCARMPTDDNLSRRGAYVLAEGEGGAAAGHAARHRLRGRARRGRRATRCRRTASPTAVVSMPCWELFELQDAAYRAACSARARVRVGCRSGAALRLGPLARRARRLRRHDRLRRFGPGRCAVRALRHHAGRDRGRGAALPPLATQSEASHAQRIVFLDRATIAPQIRAAAAGLRARADRAREHAPRRRSPSDCRRASVAITQQGADPRGRARSSCRDLKLIAVAATGTDCVDKTACAARGIAVVATSAATR